MESDPLEDGSIRGQAYQSLQKPGNSNTDERKGLLTSAYLEFEFIGRAWFAFLLNLPVDFVIRLRGNTDDGMTALARMDEAPRRFALHIPSFSVSSPVHGQPFSIFQVPLYGQRSIETTFACLKSRGSNLDPPLTHPQRVHLLWGLAWSSYGH